MTDDLTKRLTEHADWCDANEWGIPITLGDDLRAAAHIKALTAENAALQATVDRLGEFGRMFADYGGCPRDPMGRMGGVSLVDDVLFTPEIIDVDGERWIPVQHISLHELCEQVQSEKSAPERHGHWNWFHRIIEDRQGIRPFEGCTCSLCGQYGHGNIYCDNCGAKRDGEDWNG